MLQVCSDTKEVLKFLYPHGPSNSFKYPDPQNIHTIPMDDILTLVDPRTKSGCVNSDKKRNNFAIKQHHTVTTVTNLYYRHAFVTICLYMHTFNLQLNQGVLCVYKPKSAEWASR